MNYTSISQSKKLIELGLSPESADMSWRLVNYGDEAGSRYEPSLMRYVSLSHFRDRIFPKDSTVPCWSVGALMQLIPHTDLWGLRLNNYSGAKLVWTAVFEWKDRESPMVLEDNILDAVYRIVVWLLENNYIKNQ